LTEQVPSAGSVPPDVLMVALQCLDVAMLSPGVTEDEIRTMCDRAKDPGSVLPPSAGVVVPLSMVEVAAESLADSPVRTVVATGGFPHGTLSITRRQPEVKRAIRLGADEIDTVINWRAILAGNDAQAFEEIFAIKRWMRDKKLKVILETGALQTQEAIRRAAQVAIIGGADLLKSSTGTIEPGASLETAGWMMDVVAEHHAETGRMVGVKFSGGISDPVTAATYITAVTERLGFAFLSPQTFRLGSSGLLDAILAELGSEPTVGS
jgi:deoxyribose-phosphate aldolase